MVFVGVKIRLSSPKGDPPGREKQIKTRAPRGADLRRSVSLTIPAITSLFSTPLNLNGVAVDTGGDELAGIWYLAGTQAAGSFDAKRIAEGQWNFF